MIKRFLLLCLVEKKEGGEGFFLIKLELNEGKVRIEVVVLL